MRDLIERVNAPGYQDWRRQVERIGGCAHPLHFRAQARVRDRASGASRLELSTRVVLGRCQNRRARVCPSCARLYQGDMYQVVMAGLSGGKGVPASVAEHPRVFVTLTAPSFGAVHTHYPNDPNDPNDRPGGRGGGKGERGRPCHPRRTPPCPHGRPTRCWRRHGPDDADVGAPLCVDCYDYAGAVIWQASVGDLWSRLRTYLPRHLARLAGRTGADVHRSVRLSFVKLIEYQRRGLVHVHAIIRADGVPASQGQVPAAPSWVTGDLLRDAVTSAAAAVRVGVDGGAAGSWEVVWGPQVDAHPISTSARSIASYIAKYATKSTETSGWNPGAARDGDSTGRERHAARMVQTAHDLAEIPELARLRLARRANDLGYGGRVASASRRYSTTLTALRQARADHRNEQRRNRVGAGDDEGDVRTWRLIGHGYTLGEAVLAADIGGDIRRNASTGREALRDALVDEGLEGLSGAQRRAGHDVDVDVDGLGGPR